MDRSYITGHDVIQKFIRRTLSELELINFEIFIISNPSIIGEIEEQKLINDAFKSHASLLRQVSKYEIPEVRHQREFFIKSLPFAACIMLAVFFTLDYTDQSSQEIQNSQNLPLQRIVLLSELANGQFMTSVPSQDDSYRQIQIQVGPELMPEQIFSFQMLDHQGEVILESSSLLSNSDGWIFYDMTSSLELNGAYMLKVLDDDESLYQHHLLNFQ